MQKIGKVLTISLTVHYNETFFNDLRVWLR